MPGIRAENLELRAENQNGAMRHRPLQWPSHAGCRPFGSMGRWLWLIKIPTTVIVAMMHKPPSTSSTPPLKRGRLRQTWRSGYQNARRGITREAGCLPYFLLIILLSSDSSSFTSDFDAFRFRACSMLIFSPQ